eukprot:TRINITY_DN11781_c0_g1_i1.p1 TRINITY_DN11781_c0_g1~~TRINITY_DN11781_c0_g1_i1.p1  ORF type:complete len:382 (+),score=19.18 TRINITY_DN11781_c0_g1_i1:302-1447(+)
MKKIGRSCVFFSSSQKYFCTSISHDWEFERCEIENARTLPASWYTKDVIAKLETDRVFWKNWIAVGYEQEMKRIGDFVTGSIGGAPFVVCRNELGTLQAFHNVCRHHAAKVAEGKGCVSQFVCPYHGWTYDLNGKLIKATKLKGICKQNFKAKENGLKEIQLNQWGPFVFIKVNQHMDNDTTISQFLGDGGDTLLKSGICDKFNFVSRTTYTIQCNWKVYCDNFLDGGYHIEFGHKNLENCIDMKSYSNEVFSNLSIQRCKSKGNSQRLCGAKQHPVYAFIYPNLMINRYGPWMDVNIVHPINVDSCLVVYDYFLEEQFQLDQQTIDNQINESGIIAKEDQVLCESVQQGLSSPAFNQGWYAPELEAPMFHFHKLLYKDLC